MTQTSVLLLAGLCLQVGAQDLPPSGDREFHQWSLSNYQELGTVVGGVVITTGIDNSLDGLPDHFGSDHSGLSYFGAACNSEGTFIVNTWDGIYWDTSEEMTVSLSLLFDDRDGKRFSLNLDAYLRSFHEGDWTSVSLRPLTYVLPYLLSTDTIAVRVLFDNGDRQIELLDTYDIRHFKQAIQNTCGGHEEFRDYHFLPAVKLFGRQVGQLLYGNWILQNAQRRVVLELNKKGQASVRITDAVKTEGTNTHQSYRWIFDSRYDPVKVSMKRVHQTEDAKIEPFNLTLRFSDEDTFVLEADPESESIPGDFQALMGMQSAIFRRAL